MTKVVIPAAYFIRKDTAPHKIGVEYPPEYEPQVQAIIDAAERKGIKQLAWEIKLPYRPRSKGPRSQNSRFHGHCEDIAEYLGISEGEAKDGIKALAVKEGYPTKYSPISDMVIPKPTSSASVEEMNLLQEVLEEYANRNEIPITEVDEQGPYKTIGGRSREEMREWWT